MVAYSFKQRFLDPIVSGTKTQTIRGNGKRRHARVGDSLQLYCGMRTKACMKIIADPICTLDLEAFARMDGFANLSDMSAFWMENHGVGDQVGTLIGWERAS